MIDITFVDLFNGNFNIIGWVMILITWGCILSSVVLAELFMNKNIVAKQKKYLEQRDWLYTDYIRDKSDTRFRDDKYIKEEKKQWLM